MLCIAVFLSKHSTIYRVHLFSDETKLSMFGLPYCILTLLSHTLSFCTAQKNTIISMEMNNKDKEISHEEEIEKLQDEMKCLYIVVISVPSILQDILRSVSLCPLHYIFVFKKSNMNPIISLTHSLTKCRSDSGEWSVEGTIATLLYFGEGS